MEVTTVEAAAMPAAESETDYWACHIDETVVATVVIVVSALVIADICWLSIHVTTAAK